MRTAPGPTPRHPSPRTSPPSVVMRPEVTTPMVAMESLKRGGCPEHKATRREHPIRVVGGAREVGSSDIGIAAITSRSQALDAGDLEQVGELLAGVEHPGLHRALGNPDDLAGFFHRFLMIIDEVDDLAVRGGQFGDAGPQNCAGLAAVQRSFGRIGL